MDELTDPKHALTYDHVVECFRCAKAADEARLNALADMHGDPFNVERTPHQQANDAYDADVRVGLDRLRFT